MNPGNKTSGSLDSIDMGILAYLYENCTSFFEAKTIKEISDDLSFKMSPSRARHRYANLKRRKFIEEGVKTNRSKGYFLTDEGRDFLSEVSPKSPLLKNDTAY